jgi:CelD/BcsL family acetyltransferase involved in cellulose biosynthesis
MLATEVIADPRAVEELAPAWDALAVANRQPLTAPAWQLGSWRHLPPPAASLRVVAVRDGTELVGIAPFFADAARRGRVDYRLLGAALPRVSPLALPGREWEVAAAIGTALAHAAPRPDVVALEAAPLASHWAVALQEGWPGRVRPLACRYFVQPSPTISLEAPSFDAWLGGKSSNFRSQMRRIRRQFAAAGGSSRMATQATLRDDLATYMRLHAVRWENRGGASSIVPLAGPLAALYEEIGRELLDAGRFRLHLLEVEGEPISAQLFAAAGGEVIHLNGGWDERFARLKPSQLCILAGVEEAFARGDRRVDLAPGQQPYKLRFADGNDPVAWTPLIVPRPRMPLTLSRVAPTLARVRLREQAKRSLSPDQVARVRGIRTRLWRR